MKLALPSLTSRLNYRMHRKIVVIDGRIGYVGGINVADRYLEGFSWGIWRDTHARIEGKGVQGLQSVFLIDWYFVSQTLITSRDYFPKLENFGNSPMQIVNSGPLSKYNELAHGIMQAIYDAKESIFIQTPYFLPPDGMIDALQSAAIRGVDVRIMMSKRSDVHLVQMASRSFIKQMLRSGVKIFFYTKGFLHSKTMTFDTSLTLIGSANFDSRSFDQNFEVEAFIYDKEVTRQANVFVEDQRDSELVLLKEWEKRPVGVRFIESVMRLLHRCCKSTCSLPTNNVILETKAKLANGYIFRCLIWSGFYRWVHEIRIKTTVGDGLPAPFVQFIDLDAFIEGKYRKTVSQLFEERGEEGFRSWSDRPFGRWLNLKTWSSPREARLFL